MLVLICVNQLLYFQINIFGAQKSLHGEMVLLSTKNLKVIENKILHTTCPSVRSSVRTILLFVFVLISHISTLSTSYTVTIQATNHHDSSRFEPDGKIRVHRDGKKENQASIRCLMMLLRCLCNSSTDPLRLMTAALRFTTVELRMLMMPLYNRTLVRFTTSHESARFSCCHATVPWGRGGTLIFSSYVLHRKLGPSIYRSPPPPPPKKKNRNFKKPKIYLKF